MEDDVAARPGRDLDDPSSIAARRDPKAATKTPEDANNGSDSEDDSAPDYSALAALASKVQGQSGKGTSKDIENAVEKLAMPYIPKRGEKDFEPTGFVAQSKALEASRKAMFDVISCERYTSSKSISVATWEPNLNRAIVHLQRGQTFASMGYANRVQVLDDGQYADLAKAYAKGQDVLAQPEGTMKDGVWWPKIQSRLELFPEEALYLVERGSLECRVHSDQSSAAKRYASIASNEMRDYGDDNSSDEWLPMTLEQAYASMLYKDGLTRERYQLYAHLKRLGYIVQRKSFTDALRVTASRKEDTAAISFSSDHGDTCASGIVADPKRPLQLVTIFDVLLYPLRRVVQIAKPIMSSIISFLVGIARQLYTTASQTYGSIWAPRKPRADTSESSNVGVARGLLGIGGPGARTYEEAYNRLRIVPTGHDATLARFTSSAKEPMLEIFFYAWRPATHFKKTDPPLPEFQLATADARHTMLPSAYAFADLFAQLPKALSADDIAQLDEDEQRAVQRAQEEKKRNDESYGKAAARKMKSGKGARKTTSAAMASDDNHNRQALAQILSPLLPALQRIVSMLEMISRLFAHMPPGCVGKGLGDRSKGQRAGVAGAGSRRPGNIYVPLKAGRRNVIVAVNDCGTTSLLRFGESEFARWRLAGTREP